MVTEIEDLKRGEDLKRDVAFFSFGAGTAGVAQLSHKDIERVFGSQIDFGTRNAIAFDIKTNIYTIAALLRIQADNARAITRDVTTGTALRIPQQAGQEFYFGLIPIDFNNFKQHSRNWTPYEKLMFGVVHDHGNLNFRTSTSDPNVYVFEPFFSKDGASSRWGDDVYSNYLSIKNQNLLSR